MGLAYQVEQMKAVEMAQQLLNIFLISDKLILYKILILEKLQILDQLIIKLR